MSDPQSAPSSDDVAAAHAVIARQIASDAARRAALAPALQSLTGLSGFAAILARATELRDEVGTGELVYASLNAMVIGMTGAVQAANLTGTI